MKKILFALLVSLAAPLALAGAGHDHGPKYGGVVREAGNLSYELVAKADALTLYVADHGKPMSTQGATAEATLYAGNDKQTVALVPAGENKLSAQGSFKTGVGVRAAVTVTLTGKPAQKLTFKLK